MDDEDLPFTQIIPQDDLDESGVEDNEACQIATLKVVGDSKLGIPPMQFPVYRGENVIGRKMNSNICIPFGASLSKKHAVIEAEHKCTFVYDCGSSNKTKMNKMFLRPHARYELKNDSNIRFGNVMCQYTEIASADKDASTSSLIDIATTNPVSTSTILAPETPSSQDKTENKPAADNHSFSIPKSQPVVGDSPMVIPETPSVLPAPSTRSNTTSMKKLKYESNPRECSNNGERKRSAIRFQIDSDSDTDDENSNRKMNETDNSNNAKTSEVSMNTTKSETDICFPETRRISIPAMNHEIASDSEEEESILQNKDSCMFPSEFFSLDARDEDSESKQHEFKQPQLPSTSSHNSNLQVTSSSVSEEISMCENNCDSNSQPSQVFSEIQPEDSLSFLETQPISREPENNENVSTNYSDEDSLGMMPTQSLSSEHFEVEEPVDTLSVLPTQALVVNEDIASRDTMEMLATQPLMVTEDSVDSLEMLSTQSFDGNLDFYNLPTQPVLPAAALIEGSTSPVIKTRKINSSASSEDEQLDIRTEVKPSKFKPISTPKTFKRDNKMSSSTPNKMQPVPFDGNLDEVSDRSQNKTEHSIDIVISNTGTDNDSDSQKSRNANQTEQKTEILNHESKPDIPCASAAIESHDRLIIETEDDLTEEENLPSKIPEVIKDESNDIADLEQTDVPITSTIATTQELNLTPESATKCEFPCASSSIAQYDESGTEEPEKIKAISDCIPNSDVPGTSNAGNQNHNINAVEDLDIDRPEPITNDAPVNLEDSKDYDITDLILENSGLHDKSSNSNSSTNEAVKAASAVSCETKKEQPVDDNQESVKSENNIDLSTPDNPVTNLAANPPCVDELLEDVDEDACDVSTSVLEQSAIGNDSINNTSLNQNGEENEAKAPLILEDEDSCDASISELEQSTIGDESINIASQKRNGEQNEAIAPLPAGINMTIEKEKEPNNENIQQIKNILDNFISQINDDEARLSASGPNNRQVVPSSSKINSEVDAMANQTKDFELAVSYTTADENSFLTNQPVNKTDEEQLPVEEVHNSSVETSAETEVQVVNENKESCDSPLPTKKFYNKSSLLERNENDIPSTSNSPTTSTVKEVEVDKKSESDVNEQDDGHLSQNEIEDLVVSIAGQRKRKFIKKNPTTDSQESKIISKNETLEDVSKTTLDPTENSRIDHEVLELSKDVINEICSVGDEEKSTESKLEHIPPETSQETQQPQVKEITVDTPTFNASKDIAANEASSDNTQTSINSTKNTSFTSPKLVLTKADLDTSASDSDSKVSIQELFQSANIRLRRSQNVQQKSKSVLRKPKLIVKQKLIESNSDGNISDQCTQQFTEISRRRKTKTKLSNSKNTDDLATQAFVSNDVVLEHDIGTIDEDIQATQAYVDSACDIKKPEEPGCSANKITRTKRTKTNIKKVKPPTRKSRRKVPVGDNETSTSATNQPRTKKQKVMKENVNPENSADEEVMLSQTSTVYEYSAANNSATVLPSSKQSKTTKHTLQPVELQDDFRTPATRMKRKMLNPVPKIIFTGIFNTAAEKAVKNLGGEIVKDIDSATHLVTDKMRRTVKFLCAVARGLIIANVDWLMNSQKAKRFLPPSDFKINDYQYEDTCAPGELFHGISFYLTPAVVPSKDQMSMIIRSAGGSISNRLPRTTGTETTKNVVIATEKDRKKCSKAMKMNIPIVCNEFVLSGVLHKEINFDKHTLFAEDSQQDNDIPQTSSALDETVSNTTAKRKLKSPPLTRKSSRLRSAKK